MTSSLRGASLRTAPPCLSIALLVFVSALGLTAVAAAQDTEWEAVVHPRLDVPRSRGEIEVDGLLEDVGWAGIPRAHNFVEHQPGDQVQPPVVTEAMLTYDDDYLYCAFICYDDPAQVRASFTERDRIWNDDYVILALDTYGDQAWAYEIAVNPYGVQGDLLWSAGNGEDMTYDLVYYTSGRITDDGWQVEMAIPWTSLRFPDKEEQEWRVDFWRNHPRAVRGQYSWPKYDRDDSCWPCQWGFVTGITGVRPGSGLELLPAFVASQAAERKEDDSFENGDIKGEPSLGASYGISPTVTAEATINPDYSQVESDVAQIDVNSTFALFYPEKRPFFQEGSDLWNTYFNTVYTRSINKPFFAAKVTGRPGKSNFAALVAQDDISPFILPFAESSALIEGGRSFSTLARYKHTLGEQSHLGAVFTDRRHEGGGSGTVGGLDMRLRLNKNFSIEAQAQATFTTEPNDTLLTQELAGITFDNNRYTAVFDGEEFWGHGLYGSLERSARHWNFDLDYWERSPTFRAENGFEPRNDQRQTNFWTGYMLYFEGGLLDRLEPQINFGRQWDFQGTKKDEWVSASVWSRLRWAQTQVYLSYLHSNELFGGTQYDNIYRYYGSLNLKPSGMFDGGVDGSVGHRIARYDETMGNEVNVSGWINFKPIDRLKLNASYNHVHSNAVLDDRELFAGYVARSRLDLQLTREWSVRLVLQYNDFARTWDADPLLTFRLNPFSIFYVGSTRNYADFDPTVSSIEGWRLAKRTYFMKIQYLWQL